MPVSPSYKADPRHSSLGDGFFDIVAPARFPKHVLRFRNQRLAARVGLETLDETEWERHFARFEPLPDNLEKPLALRYHGYQFRVYNPQLGDGRGFLFAQLRDSVDARLLDLGTKGSGQTPWSRGGDGRLTLKGGVREVLATEMLDALGVYTSASFSLFETGEALDRGDEPSPTRSSVLVRLSHSHVRFGTFERHAYAADQERLQKLLDYTILTYYPELPDEADRPAALLRAITRRAARLAASWMTAGFVHGVLNTDNMNVTGESFDYGPYRFAPVYDLDFTAAYFDHSGLYAFGRQPGAVQWSLLRLAEALSPIANQETLAAALRGFGPAFWDTFRAGLCARLGLVPRGEDDDGALLRSTYQFLEESRLPLDRFFFDWYGGEGAASARAARSPVAPFYELESFAEVKALLARYRPSHPERLGHPYFERDAPVTLVIDEIERLWSAIAERDDWSPFEAKLADIAILRDLYAGAFPRP